MSPSAWSTWRPPAVRRVIPGITEIGAVKVRGGELLGEFQTLVNPAEPIPPFIAVLTGITDLMVASSPRIGSVLPAFLEFAARLRAGRAQRALRRGIPQARQPGARLRLARLRRRRHRPAGPPGAHPRRDAELQARHPGEVLPHHDHAEPPRPVRRARHGRRTARALRAGRIARRADAGGPADVSRPGSLRRCGRSGTWPSRCLTHRVSTCSPTTAARCSTSASRRTCATASGRTSPPPRRGPGSAR